ncbi:MAG: hypothetical protein QME12_04700 [Nanoarchaeota archaeon]|nr:hypothetical protein [Nanoarchaeota archaeon]
MPGFLEIIKQKFFSNSSAANPWQDKADALEKSVQQSFGNLRKDMEHISKLLHYFNSANQKQSKQISMFERRLRAVELSIDKASGEELEEIEEKEEAAERASGNMDDETMWETLTESQQKLCWKLAALQKEMPDQWISLKYLAQELYPDKEYGAIRSTLSQFVTALEEMGFVKRKRKGKQAYIISTNNNPCMHRKMPVVETEKSRVKSKKL